MISVQLRSRVKLAKIAGYKPKPSDVSVLLNEDAAVYKPDGELLCLLRRAAIPHAVGEVAYPALHWLKGQKTDNRGSYTGAVTSAAAVVFKGGGASKSTRARGEDGKILGVSSAIIGYFDRMGGRHPYCRATAFTANEVEKWATVLPMVQQIAGEFARDVPQRHRAQSAFIKKVKPCYVIAGTPFTTLTVNNNVVAATHIDKGDYKAGFGIISCLRRGSYKGAWLCFPEYGVAADLQDGDIFYFNSHDWHGLTPFEEAQEGHERISVVYYARERMLNCGTPEEEIANARRTRGLL